MELSWRRWWTSVVSFGAVVLVTGAVLAGAFQLAMLAVPGYREFVAQEISTIIGQPLEIGGVGLGWSRLSPQLNLTDITLFGESNQTPALNAERLTISLGLRRILQGDLTPKAVEISGAELFAKIDSAGKFSLRGIDTSGMPAQGTQAWLKQIAKFGHIRLSRIDLELKDARLTPVSPRFRLEHGEIIFTQGRGEIRASLQLPDEMGASIEIEGNIAGSPERPQMWSGRWQAQVTDLRSLPWLNESLADNAQVAFRETELALEGQLLDGQLSEVSLLLEAKAVRGQLGQTQCEIEDIILDASLSPMLNGWLFDVDRLSMRGPSGLWPDVTGRLKLTQREGVEADIEAQASYLNIADLAPWLQLFPASDSLHDIEQLGGAEGIVRNLVLYQDGVREGETRRFDLRADLDEVKLIAGQQNQEISGLTGTLSASENGGRIDLMSRSLRVEIPRAFSKPVQFEEFQADLVWARSSAGWRLNMLGATWRASGTAGRADIALTIPGTGGAATEIALDASFEAEDVTQLKAYMPLHWPPKLKNWLNQSIRAGRVLNGHIQVQGALPDFPFTDAPGLFAIDLDVADAELKYAPDWPTVEKASARIEFRGNGLGMELRRGVVSGVMIDAASATISDFASSILQIKGETHGDLAAYYAFLANSPIRERVAGLLTQTSANGSVDVDVDLVLPLKAIKEASVKGTASINEAVMSFAGLAEPAMDISGIVNFSNRGVGADSLAGRMYGHLVTAKLALEPERGLVLRGALELDAAVAQQTLPDLVPAFILEVMEGRSPFNFSIDLSGQHGGRMVLSSRLQGMTIDLPEPLGKASTEQQGLRVEIVPLANRALRLAVRLGCDVAAAKLAFHRDNESGRLGFFGASFQIGKGEPAEPDRPEVLIAGRLPQLRPLEWISAIGRHQGGVSAAASGWPANGRLQLSSNLVVDELRFGKFRIADVNLKQTTRANGWNVAVKGMGADGSLFYSPDSHGGEIEGRFSHLKFLPIRRDISDNGQQGPDEDAVLAKGAESKPIAPDLLPTLLLSANSLRFGDADLGRLDVQTKRISGGQKIIKLITAGKSTSLNITGQWQRISGRSAAGLQLVLETAEVDDLLLALGYAANLSATHAKFKVDALWPFESSYAATGIVPALADGQFDIRLEQGLLRSIHPGAGRVLGLFNFWALPRRLSLDFRDVLSDGLGFDEIAGRFALKDGIAQTNNLDIKAPSLTMEIRGNVGLQDRSYDQRVKVYPDVSAGVTLGALLLGGPAAGALALIAQQMLDQPLDQVGQLSYRLTGSWEDPTVERTQR